MRRFHFTSYAIQEKSFNSKYIESIARAYDFVPRQKQVSKSEVEWKQQTQGCKDRIYSSKLLVFQLFGRKRWRFSNMSVGVDPCILVYTKESASLWCCRRIDMAA